MDACAKFLLQFKVLFNLLHQLKNSNQGGFSYSTLRIIDIQYIFNSYGNQFSIQFYQLLAHRVRQNIFRNHYSN